MKVEWLERSLMVGPYFTLCTKEEMLREALEHCGITKPVPFLSTDHANATTHFLTNKKCESCAVVCLGSTEGREPIVVAGLLVHEAVHIWQEHRARIGEDAPGQEIEAYAIQWLSQQLFWEYVRQTSVQGEPIPE